MTTFKEEVIHDYYRVHAIYDGIVLFTYETTQSSIDMGVINIWQLPVKGMPLDAGLFLTNLITNHGWFEIKGGYIWSVSIDRYSGTERRERVAKIFVS